MPWFARPHREHHQFLAATDESAVSTVSNTSTEDCLVGNTNSRLQFTSHHHKRLSENRPRSKTHPSHEDFLELPSGMFCQILIHYKLGESLKVLASID